MEASKTVVRLLALAAMAQGYLSIPTDLAEATTGPEQLETHVSADPGTTPALGVL
jgi:hypothetical protein